MSGSDSYDVDIVLWTERQAALLRQAAAAHHNTEDAPDWPNIIEEIESVSRSELHAVQSLLIQALLHELKVMAWPLSSDVPYWQAEARGFWRQVRRQFTPSMRQKIDLADLYADALDRLPSAIDGVAPMPVPTACWVSHDDLLKAT